MLIFINALGGIKMYKDSHIRQILEDLVQTSCFELGLNPNDFPVKHMGLVKQRGEYKYGWYLEIQNFTNLHMVKQSQNDRFWRYTFRSVMFSDESEPTLMVMKWTPSMGSVEDNENIFQGKYLKDSSKFIQLLISTLMDLKN